MSPRWTRGRNAHPVNALPLAELEQALARIVVEQPNVTWAALGTTRGTLLSRFPHHQSPGPDRISAMSAAMLSLGERISAELHTGELRYTLVAGREGTSLVTPAGRDHVLALGLSGEGPVDADLDAAGRAALSLAALLEGTPPGT